MYNNALNPRFKYDYFSRKRFVNNVNNFQNSVQLNENRFSKFSNEIKDCKNKSKNKSNQRINVDKNSELESTLFSEGKLSKNRKKQFDGYLSDIQNQSDRNSRVNSKSYRQKNNTTFTAPLLRNNGIYIKIGQNKDQISLIDSGSSCSYFSEKFVKNCKYLNSLPKLQLDKDNKSALLADNTRLRHEYKLKCNFQIEGRWLNHEFIIAKGLNTEVILGSTFLRQYGVSMSFLNDKVYFNKDSKLYSYTDYKIKPGRSAVITIKISDYLHKGQLICVQPAIQNVRVQDSVHEIQSNGRYQSLKIIVVNDQMSSIYISKNHVLGLYDLINQEQLSKDPIQHMLHKIQCELSEPIKGTFTDKSNIKGTFTDKSNFKGTFTEKSNNANTLTESSLPDVKFFDDKSVNLEMYPKFSEEMGFQPLTGNIGNDTREKLQYLLMKNEEVFHKPGTYLPCVNDFVATLPVRETEQKFKPAFYPIHPKKVEATERTIAQLESMGVIEPVHQGMAPEIYQSQFSSPCLILDKPGCPGECRMVTDLRALNARLRPFTPSFSMSVDLNLIQLSNMPLNCLSQLDVSSAYYQLKLSDSSLPFSIVSIGSERYLVKRLLQGASLSASLFTYYMGKTLHGLTNRCLVFYLDDITLCCSNEAAMLKLLHEVFSRFAKCGLKLKASKCFFFKKNITFLGNVIDGEQRSLQPKTCNTEALINSKLPNNFKSLRQFLGLCQYFRCYIPNLADKAKCLYSLLKGKQKTGKITLKQQHITAINTLKQAMASPPLIHLPNFDKEFYLTCDASKEAIAGCLFQKADDSEGKGKINIISYCSRTLNKAQKNYSAYVLEGLAIVSSLLSLSDILTGSKCNVYTDSISLKYLFNSPKCFSKINQSKIARWLSILQQFRLSINFIRGKHNNLSDYLSRHADKAPHRLLKESQVNSYFEKRLLLCKKQSKEEIHPLAELENKGIKLSNNISPTQVLMYMLNPEEYLQETLFQSDYYNNKIVLDSPEESSSEMVRDSDSEGQYSLSSPIADAASTHPQVGSNNPPSSVEKHLQKEDKLNQNTKNTNSNSDNNNTSDNDLELHKVNKKHSNDNKLHLETLATNVQIQHFSTNSDTNQQSSTEEEQGSTEDISESSHMYLNKIKIKEINADFKNTSEEEKVTVSDNRRNFEMSDNTRNYDVSDNRRIPELNGDNRRNVDTPKENNFTEKEYTHHNQFINAIHSMSPSQTSEDNTDLKKSRCFEKARIIKPPNYIAYDIIRQHIVHENLIIDYAKPDGACFYRAISKALYGSEDNHKQLRRTIVDYMKINKHLFTMYIDGEVNSHLQNMYLNTTWATTAEIYGAATALNRDIFVLTPTDAAKQNYQWLHFKPKLTKSPKHCFLSIVNTSALHYDRIAKPDGGCNCNSKPPMSSLSDAENIVVSSDSNQQPSTQQSLQTEGSDNTPHSAQSNDNSANENDDRLNVEHIKLAKQYDIYKLQQEDTFTKAVYTYLTSEQLPKDKSLQKQVYFTSQSCTLINDRVYKLQLNQGNRIKSPNVFQLLIPTSMTHLLISQAHVLTSHAGIATLLSYLRERYHWPKMMSDCLEYIKKCTECNTFAKSLIKYKTTYIHADESFSTTLYDIIGPYQETKAGHKYILQYICARTNYVICKPLKTIAAQEVCDQLLAIFLDTGFPRSAISDCGSSFISKLNKCLEEKLGIHKFKLNSYQPWTVGRSEVRNAVIGARLAKLTLEKPDSWDEHIKFTVFSLNNTISARTGCSPRQLVFGTEIRTPISTLIDCNTQELSIQEEYKLKLQSLQDSLLKAREHSQKYVTKMVENSDKKIASDHQYQIFDRVWLYRPFSSQKRAKKFQTKFQGPFYIHSQVGKNSYKIIKQLGQHPMRFTAHASRLRPYYLPNKLPQEPTPYEQNLISGTEIPETETENEILKDMSTEPPVRHPDTSFQIAEQVNQSNLSDQPMSDVQITHKTYNTQKKVLTKRRKKIDCLSDNEFLNSASSAKTDGNNSDKRKTDKNQIDSPIDAVVDEATFISMVPTPITERTRPRLTRAATVNRHLDSNKCIKFKSIHTVFGKMPKTQSKNSYLIRLVDGHILSTTKMRFDNQTVDYLHGKNVPQLTQRQAAYIKQKYDNN